MSNCSIADILGLKVRERAFNLIPNFSNSDTENPLASLQQVKYLLRACALID
jgi:hypothetical protein